MPRELGYRSAFQSRFTAIYKAARLFGTALVIGLIISSFSKPELAAHADELKAPNSAFVNAYESYNAAKDYTGAKKLIKMYHAKLAFEQFIDDYSNSELAIKLLSNQSIGKFKLSELEELISISCKIHVEACAALKSIDYYNGHSNDILPGYVLEKGFGERIDRAFYKSKLGSSNISDPVNSIIALISGIKNDALKTLQNRQKDGNLLFSYLALNEIDLAEETAKNIGYEDFSFYSADLQTLYYNGYVTRSEFQKVSEFFLPRENDAMTYINEEYDIAFLYSLSADLKGLVNFLEQYEAHQIERDRLKMYTVFLGITMRDYEIIREISNTIDNKLNKAIILAMNEDLIQSNQIFKSLSRGEKSALSGDEYIFTPNFSKKEYRFIQNFVSGQCHNGRRKRDFDRMGYILYNFEALYACMRNSEDVTQFFKYFFQMEEIDGFTHICEKIAFTLAARGEYEAMEVVEECGLEEFFKAHILSIAAFQYRRGQDIYWP